jgi:Peptidase family M48
MKKYNYFLVIIMSLFLTNVQYAVQPAITKASEPFIKNLMKKVFSKTMTGLHWTLAAGDSIFIGIKNARDLFNEEKICNNYNFNDATPEVNNFILSTLRQIDSFNIESVKVGHFYGPMGVIKKHVLLDHKTANEIKEALATNNQIILDKWRGTLEHENSHLQHNDCELGAITALIMPFVTHSSVKAIRNIIPIAKKTRSFLAEQLIKIPTAIGKGTISVGSLTTFMRQQEQRADNDVSNDINKLNGIKTVLEEINQKRNSMLFPFITDPTQREALLWALNFFETHPLPEKRIKKINQRIAALQELSSTEKYDDSQYCIIDDQYV